MVDARLERNWKMAHAASDHIMRPANESYRNNYDDIFRKPKKRKPKTPKNEDSKP